MKPIVATFPNMCTDTTQTQNMGNGAKTPNTNNPMGDLSGMTYNFARAIRPDVIFRETLMPKNPFKPSKFIF